MQPVRKVVAATHFKQMFSNGSYKWTPCLATDQGAIRKTWSEIGGHELLEPGLTMADFLASLHNVKPSVSQDDLKKQEEWTKEFGTKTSFRLCRAHHFIQELTGHRILLKQWRI